MRIIDSISHYKSDKVLVRFPDISISVTAEMLIKNSSCWAQWMISNQIHELGIQMGNCPEFLYLLTGALRAGIKTWIFSVLHDVEPVGCFVIYDGKNQKIKHPYGTDIHSIDCCTAYNKQFHEYDWKENEAFLVLETSGTSGKRSFASKTWHFANPVSIKVYEWITRLFHLKVFNSSQWYHNTGITLLLLSLTGCLIYEHITIQSFNPVQVKKFISDIRPTVWVGTGSMLYRSYLSDDSQMYFPPIIAISGETAKSEYIRLFAEHGICYNAYGTTETGEICSYLCISSKTPLWIRLIAVIAGRFNGLILHDANQVGDCFVGDVCDNISVDIRNKDVNGIGEIWAKTGTHSVETGDSFFCTGDLGYMNGRELYVVGRSSSVINRSGEKIMPSEIEDAVIKIDTVKDAVVFPIPSETHGEGICLCVEGSVTEEQVKRVLPKYLWPQELHCFDEFPLNASGKVDPRQFLRKEKEQSE